MVDVKEVFGEVLEVLAVRQPLTYLILKHFDVLYVDRYGGMVRAITDGKRIVLFREWLDVDLMMKMFVLMHEVRHIMCRHPIRAKHVISKYATMGCDPRIVHMLYWLCTDAVVNFSIKQEINELRDRIELYLFTDDQVRGKSAEDLLELLLKKYEADQSFRRIVDNLISKIEEKAKEFAHENEIDEMLEGADGEVVELNKGDMSGITDEEEYEKALTDVIVRSAMAMRSAGRELSEFERMIVDEITKPKINWMNVLKQDMVSWIRKTVVNTWAKAHRKYDDLPGQQAIAKGDVYVFVDVSGSITDDELRRFVTELYGIAKAGINKMVVVFWDTRSREFVIKSERDIDRISITGGGGTIFSQALEKYVGKIKPWDYVIVMTDCYWFDVDKAKSLLAKVRGRKVLVKVDSGVGDVDDVFDKIINLYEN